MSGRTNTLIPLPHHSICRGSGKKEEFLHWGNPHTLAGVPLRAASSYESIDGGPQHPGSRPFAPPSPGCHTSPEERERLLAVCHVRFKRPTINPLNPELNPICYLLALLAHHFLHVSRIRVKSLSIRLLMSYIHGARILDVSRSHTTTHHSR